MNTYRAYVLDVTKPAAPVAHVVFVRGEKYADAWKNGRAALNGDKRGKGDAKLFTDAEAKTLFASYGEKLTFVRCDNMRVRNVKIDVAALRAALADPKTSDAEKLAAMKTLAGA